MNCTNPTIADLVELIATLQTPEELAYMQQQVSYRFRIPELRNALFARFADLLHNQTGQSSTANCVQQNGISYDLNEWLTLSQYVKVFNLKSTNVLTNWIGRGLIPADCVVEIQQLNGLKLIRNQPYRIVGS